MLFVGVTRFKPGVQSQHDTLRSAFNAHLMQPLNPRIRLAGPIFDKSGSLSGVFMLLESDSAQTVQDFIENSPYAHAGLYERIDIDAVQFEIGHL